ncbi:hypothetical protein HYW84_03930 [Candidatus Peregrinibacteria bacterium]|nr:hypothetical protein [Candidatus Peregrinibacteria bacterium]
MVRAHATPDDVKAFQIEQQKEIRAHWLYCDNSQLGKALRGEYLSLRAHRKEVVGFAAQEIGALEDVVRLETDISIRKNALAESGVDPRDDRLLQELMARLKVAGRACALKALDHPTVQRVMEYTHIRMQEIRSLFVQKQNKCQEIQADSQEIAGERASTRSLLHLYDHIRTSVNAGAKYVREERSSVPRNHDHLYSSVSPTIKPSIGGAPEPL